MLTRRSESAVAVFLSAAYVIVCTQVAMILYGDYPDHLARAAVLADLWFHEGRQFGAIFQFRFMPIPYILGDLLLAGAIELLGVTGATAFWTALNLLSLPLAILFYLRVTRTGRHTRALFFITGLYLATNWFFLAGFLNFHLAVALVIVALALAQSLRTQWSLAMFIAYAGVVALGYLMHLAFIVFFAVALGATALWQLRMRAAAVLRDVVLFGPVCLVLAWHVFTARFFPDAAEAVCSRALWRTVPSKLRHLDWDLVRLYEPLDLLIALGFVACVVFVFLHWGGRRSFANADVAAVEMFVLAIAFLVLYAALPATYCGPSYLDVRALALAGPFVAFALLMLVDPLLAGHERARGFLNTAFTLLALGNLIYLGVGLAGHQTQLTKYRALTASIPSGARVLPINTLLKEGQWRPFLHSAPLAVVVDRGGIVPNMFSGDQRHPMKYFRYVNRGYAPKDDWYTRTMLDPPLVPLDVDWTAIACSYDFLLVTKPYEPARIHVRTAITAQNSSGALLKIDRPQCLGALPPPG